MDTVYRFVLESTTPYHRFDTGASYIGCSPDRTETCDPRQFASLRDAWRYARDRGETLYRVRSADEVWSLVDGTFALDPSRVIADDPGEGALAGNGLLLAGVGVAALLLLRR